MLSRGDVMLEAPMAPVINGAVQLSRFERGPNMKEQDDY